MTAAAALRFEQVAAFGQFRHAGHVAFLMAAAAGGADVVFRQERVLPERHVAVRVLFVGGSPWPPWQMVQPNFDGMCGPRLA